MSVACAEKYVKAAEERDALRLVVSDYERLDAVRLRQVATATTALSASLSLIDQLTVPPPSVAWYEEPVVILVVGVVLGVAAVRVAVVSSGVGQ